MFWVKHLPWDYGVKLHQEEENIEVAFQALPLAEIMASVKAVHDEPDQVPSKEASLEHHPTFGSHTNNKVADFDFKKAVEPLPFKLILGDIPLDKKHQAKFIDLIYSNQEEFSLHDEYLGYCDWLTLTILMNTDKAVYLQHRQFLDNFRDRCANVLTPGFTKGSFDHPTVPMHLKLLFSAKYLGRLISVWTIENWISSPSGMHFLYPHWQGTTGGAQL